MALPTSDQLLSLDYDDRGLPFVWVEAKSLTTESLDYDSRGLPFVGATGAAGPATTGYVKVYLSSVWTEKPVKWYNGSSWVTKPVKYYNGAAWVSL